MSRLTLSVLIANYNYAHTLERSIESVLSQSRQPDEFVIIDDASTDGSEVILDRYAAAYPWLRLIRHEKNLGAMATIQEAQRVITGDFGLCFGSDDYVSPGAIEKFMAAAERHPTVAFIQGEYIAADLAGKELWRARVEAGPSPMLMTPSTYMEIVFEEMPPYSGVGGGRLFRRAALEEADLRPELHGWLDTYAAHVAALRHGCYYLPEPLLVLHMAENSLSAKTSRDPKILLDIMGRAAWLMRSPQYRELFPESCVQRWERRCREVCERMAPPALGALDTSFHQVSEEVVKALDPHRLAERIVRSVVFRTLRACLLLTRITARRALRHYRPDLSCYGLGGSR